MIKFRNNLPVLMLVLCGLLWPVKTLYADDQNQDAIPADKIQQFVEVFKRVKEQYVDDIDDEVLFDFAIQGMVSSLDPHSSFLSKDDFNELKIGTTGRFGGLGIEITMEDGFVKIISPIDDTPASRAGLKSGDFITKIDETLVKGLTIGEAVKLMRGKPGSQVTITVVREGETKPLIIDLTREIIVAKGVKSELIDSNIGYIRLSSFQSQSTKHIHDSVLKLKKDSGNELKGLVLDLRNNPGGVLGSAVGIADLFLSEGKIVYTKGRTSNSDLEYFATSQDIIDDIPMIVLINEGSASASEIVAGALQDNKRAKVLGTKSYGKASVQTIQEFSDGTALKLTTARYFTPNGRDIHTEGIEPDIIIERERKNAEGEKTVTTASELLQDDNQLTEALKVIETLTTSKIY
ncbi:MAG: S41 family peptidase [Pseudomonadota bacterium]|nr:S41 family peptidase [Pseudomonadota bacterium]MED5274498.1 S41 family peptidase [Pseudomonadota bacterium]MED5430586.1 S41 family peptidase [Pseudomonadota bacterium]|tara:strand:- start:905 stop:2122 length:1218 start_codon:yes stop_codon:yes gene_type:complete